MSMGGFSIMQSPPQWTQNLLIDWHICCGLRGTAPYKDPLKGKLNSSTLEWLRQPCLQSPVTGVGITDRWRHVVSFCPLLFSCFSCTEDKKTTRLANCCCLLRNISMAIIFQGLIFKLFCSLFCGQLVLLFFPDSLAEEFTNHNGHHSDALVEKDAQRHGWCCHPSGAEILSPSIITPCLLSDMQTSLYSSLCPTEWKAVPTLLSQHSLQQEWYSHSCPLQ